MTNCNICGKCLETPGQFDMGICDKHPKPIVVLFWEDCDIKPAYSWRTTSFSKI